MNFFIMGLPRSRTAWLANFMTYDGLFCHHEGINKCTTMEEYRHKIGNDGDSGTGLILFDMEIRYPDAKILVIDSNPEQSFQWCRKNMGAKELDRPYFWKLKMALDQTNGLHIPLTEVNDRLQEIWEYFTDKPYNEQRGELLKGFNIQMHDLSVLDGEAAMELFKSEEMI